MAVLAVQLVESVEMISLDRSAWFVAVRKISHERDFLQVFSSAAAAGPAISLRKFPFETKDQGRSVHIPLKSPLI